MKKKSPRDEAPDEPSETDEVNEVVSEETGRNKEMSDDEKIKDDLLDLYKDIEKGFEDQGERADSMLEFWDCYNCKLNEHQFYNGNSQIYVPIIKDAITARKTRFTNQLFPQGGRYVEATASNGDIPDAEIALLESYVRKAKLRTQVVPALILNGDIEGQYTVYLEWEETTREVTWRASKTPTLEDEDGETELPTDEKVIDIKSKVLKTGRPQPEVIADSDILVMPATADSLISALQSGGSVTILRRWSKAKIKEMKKRGLIKKDEADALLEQMKQKDPSVRTDKKKEMVDAAGIKGEGTKHALVYETWHMLTVEKKRRIYRTYFGSEKAVLSCKRNPYWSDRLPIFSCPVDKVQGSFKGKSKVEAVASLQYQANDACNEGMDSAAFALMPIIMTDPEKNPRVGSMILSLAAVWETSPDSTKFAQFPALWKDSLEIIASVKAQVQQTLSVNAAQITQGGSGKKPSKSDIANEQQIDILTTNDAVTVIEEEILTPMLSFMIEMDHQFRDTPTMVRAYGPMGVRAAIQQVEPISMDNAYVFRWFGVEQARNAQQIQQQIALLNVIKGVQPNLYEGYTLDLGPVMAQMVENTLGPRLGPLTFKDARQELGLDPETENQLMLQGFPTPVHKMDDHMAHVKAHMAILDKDGHGTVRPHIMAHMQALAKAQGDNQQKQQGGPPQGGPPGGAPPQGPPGMAPGGGPRPGAQPMPPRGVQNPAGAIHQDQMQDPSVMPR